MQRPFPPLQGNTLLLEIKNIMNSGDIRTSALVKTIQLISGRGQFHTPNTEAKHPKPLELLSLENIISLVKVPNETAKEKAQWVMLTSSNGPLAREHSFQFEYGSFHALWCDLDKMPDTSLSWSDFISGIMQEIFPPDTFSLAYNTKSATKENPKCRIIVPLVTPCTGSQFKTYQKIFNDKLSIAGVEPDRATERTGQLCYLPNRGSFYNHHITGENPFDISAWEGEVKQEQERLEELNRAIVEQRIKAIERCRERVDTGELNPMEAFNHAYPIEGLFSQYGYVLKGKKWLSPLSQSKTHGVSIAGDKWFSHHDSDSGIGRATDTGSMGDAFDLFVYYENGGDRNRALKAAGEMFHVNGRTLNKTNQINYMAGQDQPGETEKKPADAFDIRAFSLNGRSREMEKQMLEDKFALLRMAILGQSTVFYAKPNAGKTLIILYGIREGIKNGEIKGDDVIYVNADDTYKGLVYKLKIAEQYGFHMVAPGHSAPGSAVFKSQDLTIYINNMISNGTASGKIFILDTVKKFTDLMSKDKCSKFGETIRQFISHGGTVISVAHANKHRDDDKKIIYSGTADLVDDADCAYTLDVVQDDADGIRTVKFENFKSRGDVVLEAFYQYNYLPGTTYPERLDSVKPVDKEERAKAVAKSKLDFILRQDQPVIDAVIECISEGITTKTALIAEASSRSGVSKPKTTKAIAVHTGTDRSQNQFWFIETGENNSKNYKLNYGVSNAK